MRLVLHIGQQKAGSTALQDVLKRNVKELAKQGVCYPLVLKKENSQASIVGNIFEATRWPRLLISDEKKEPGIISKRADELIDAIQSFAARRKDFHTIVVSTEYFFRKLTPSDEARLRMHFLTNLMMSRLLPIFETPLAGIYLKVYKSPALEPPK